MIMNEHGGDLVTGLIVVLDIGKTLSKLTLWTAAGVLVDRRTRPNARHVGGPYATLDTDGIEAWVAETLTAFARMGRVVAIVPVGHGAAAAIVRDGRLATPVIDYESALPAAERARYDARYGYGAYVRLYPRPVWDETRWSYVAPTPGYYGAPSAGYYGRNTAYTTVRCNNNSTVAAGAVGALLGGILGSNVAARNARTEGTVLGAVVGGAIGAGVGHANDKYKCDARGPYFTYSETLPYRESQSWRYGSNDPTYYSRMRCRLAPAPIDPNGVDYRYVRVCPDASGRYRITG